MRQNIFLLFISLSLASFAQVRDAASYVNPFIGTGGMGHCFPGACAPFGIVQLSPDTDTIPHNVSGKYVGKVYEYCAGYQYEDKTIVGFSHTHLSGTGHSDLGDIMVMPQTGRLRLNPGTADNPDSGYRERFSHDTEKASAGYYEVTLADSRIRCQLTATCHAGFHKYTFPKGSSQRIIIDLLHGLYNYDGKVLWSSIRVEDDHTLTGHRITNGWARENFTYFAIRFSKPIASYGYRNMRKASYMGFMRKLGIYENFPEIAGRDVVSYFEFDSQDENLEVQVGLSAVSAKGALSNLEAEAAGSFDDTLSKTRMNWNNELSQIICNGTDDEKTMLYTSFYHTMINPSVYQDVDGRYRGLDGETHENPGRTNYTVFSLWDTYRAEHPLLGLLKPKRNLDMVNSMLDHQKQNVHHILPIWSLMANEGWCMTGYHAVSVVADEIIKNIDISDPANDRFLMDALDAMDRTANCPYMPGLKKYRLKGFCPSDNDQTAASNTLEYSYDDFCIWAVSSRIALMSKNDLLRNRAAIMAEKFRDRAYFYLNVIDRSKGFASPRTEDGLFKQDLDPYQTYGEGFIEGNSWNFTFQAPHDVLGLIEALGGDIRFTAKLDELFSMDLPPRYYENNEDITADCLVGGYVHGNEPSHHIPYLYSWTSSPWKTQKWLRTIMNRMYRNAVRGLGGNDDCGQMSAWFVFTAMGFYPVCPGVDEYVLGAPYLPYMRISLDNGKIIEIKAPLVSDQNRYVKSVRINGVPYSRLFVTHKQLIDGAVIEFEMDSKPNLKRGLRQEDKPWSMTRGGLNV